MLQAVVEDFLQGSVETWAWMVGPRVRVEPVGPAFSGRPGILR
jgi:hypothetical protein